MTFASEDVAPKKMICRHSKTSTFFCFSVFFWFSPHICWYIFVTGARSSTQRKLHESGFGTFLCNKCIVLYRESAGKSRPKMAQKYHIEYIDIDVFHVFSIRFMDFGPLGSEAFFWESKIHLWGLWFCEKKVKEDTCLWTNSFCPTGCIHFNTDVLPMLPYMCSNYICNWYHWTDSLLECEVKGFLFVAPKNLYFLLPEILGAFFWGAFQP